VAKKKRETPVFVTELRHFIIGFLLIYQPKDTWMRNVAINNKSV
jgi:hypothetical protein